MAATFEINNWKKCFEEIFNESSKSDEDFLKLLFEEFCKIGDLFQSEITTPIEAHPIYIQVNYGDSSDKIERNKFYSSEKVIAVDTVRKEVSNLIKNSKNGKLYITQKWFITLITYLLANKEQFLEKKYFIDESQLTRLLKEIKPIGSSKNKIKLAHSYNEYLELVFSSNEWLSGSFSTKIIDPKWTKTQFKVDGEFYFRSILSSLSSSDNKINEPTENDQDRKVNDVVSVRTLSKFPKYSILVISILIGVPLILYFLFFKGGNVPFEEIKIGDQIWSSEINIPVPGSVCYEGNDSNCENLGRLYSLKAARKIADLYDGWELPYYSDIQKLIDYFPSKQELMNVLVGNEPGELGIKLTGVVHQNSNGREMFSRMGIETAIWSNSISSEYEDLDGIYRPYALRVLDDDIFGSICDCWTIHDKLSIRLIKTDRGNKVDIISEENIPEEEILIDKPERREILNGIIEEVGLELKNDFNNDSIKKLSDVLISKIHYATQTLAPYKMNSGRLLSPERGELLHYLFLLNLDENTIGKIINGADFSYSDLSNKDLSKFDWGRKGLFGIHGQYNNEVTIMVTANKRIKLNNSNFNNSDLQAAKFYADLQGSSFINSKLFGTEFIWSDLSDCSFVNGNLKQCYFLQNQMNRVSFMGGVLKGSQFSFCDLRGANFDYSTITSDLGYSSFSNCFFGSMGTFFDYFIQLNPSEIYLFGRPYIEESKTASGLGIPIVTIDEIKRKIKSKKIPINQDTEDGINLDELDNSFEIVGYKDSIHQPYFTFFGDNFSREDFREKLKKSNYLDPSKNELFSYMVRIGDNNNRSAKLLRSFYSFEGDEFTDEEARSEDTLTYYSSHENLSADYRGKKYVFEKTKNRSIASFVSSDLRSVSFSYSTLDYVSFSKSTFKRVKFDENYMHKSNFRIKNGDAIVTNCHFSALFVNKVFSKSFFQKDLQQYLEFKSGFLFNKKKYPNNFYEDLEPLFASQPRRW